MTWVATAIIGSAVVGGLSARSSAKSASKSNDKAVRAQTTAANDSAQIQRDQLQYVKDINKPYQEAGVNALGQLTTQTPENMMMADPGYQFRLQEGNKAIQNNLLARGQGFSGAQLRATQDYSQGLASQEYSNAFNRLYQIAGLGSGANQGAAAGSANASGGVSNSLLAGGDAIAGGAINSANIGTNFGQNITGIASSTLGNLAYLNAMNPGSSPGKGPVSASKVNSR